MLLLIALSRRPSSAVGSTPPTRGNSPVAGCIPQALIAWLWRRTRTTIIASLFRLIITIIAILMASFLILWNSFRLALKPPLPESGQPAPPSPPPFPLTLTIAATRFNFVFKILKFVYLHVPWLGSLWNWRTGLAIDFGKLCCFFCLVTGKIEG